MIPLLERIDKANNLGKNLLSSKGVEASLLDNASTTCQIMELIEKIPTGSKYAIENIQSESKTQIRCTPRGGISPQDDIIYTLTYDEYDRIIKITTNSVVWDIEYDSENNITKVGHTTLDVKKLPYVPNVNNYIYISKTTVKKEMSN